jgi:hypothetical protein
MKKLIYTQCKDGYVYVAAIHPDITEPFYIAMLPNEVDKYVDMLSDDVIQEMGESIALSISMGECAKAFREYSDDIFFLPTAFLGKCYIKFMVHNINPNQYP